MNVTQVSLFLENKPGHLQHVLKVLAERDINILTLTIAELADYGIVRMIVNRPDEAIAALRTEHITCSATDVLAIAIDDTPGALLKALDTFAARNLNIEYMYAFTEKRDGYAIMIFRFENIDKAKEALAAEGFNIIAKIDIIGA